jgi:hypothetical protein
MGWISRRGSKPSDWKKEILSDYDSSDRCKVVDHKATCFGTHWWVLFETKDKVRFIVLYLFKRFEDGWGYKDMDESMFPYYFDCPVSLLNKAGESDNEQTTKWRQVIREQRITTPESRTY